VSERRISSLTIIIGGVNCIDFIDTIEDYLENNCGFVLKLVLLEAAPIAGLEASNYSINLEMMLFHLPIINYHELKSV
jgi:hypothetical protein